MIREHLFSKRAPADPDFRWRGGDVSRIEALSDGVFALTITLLVVSASAPKSFYDLMLMARDLPAFVVSMSVILMAWYYHYLYFRRYGLEDFTTMILNSLFLFLIMFLAFPLKFLATFLWFLIIGENTQMLFVVPEFAQNITIFGTEFLKTPALQRMGMMYFYGFGIFGVFGTLAILQLRALRMASVLELDELEITLTRYSIYHHCVDVIIATLSLTVLAVTSNPGLSGVIYFLMPFSHAALGWLGGNKVTLLREKTIANNND
jgi:hypothetical protein